MGATHERKRRKWRAKHRIAGVIDAFDMDWFVLFAQDLDMVRATSYSTLWRIDLPFGFGLGVSVRCAVLDNAMRSFPCGRVAGLCVVFAACAVCSEYWELIRGWLPCAIGLG